MINLHFLSIIVKALKNKNRNPKINNFRSKKKKRNNRKGMGAKKEEKSVQN